MRFHGFTLVGALVALSLPALAQTTPAPSPAAPAAQAGAQATADAAPKGDPVVAKVNGQEIHASDVREAMAGLPDEYRSLPPNMLFPMMVDQLVDRKALLLLAQKQGLDKDPQVQRQMTRAADAALQNALLSRTVGPLVTEQKVKERYDTTIANKPGEEEVHARHILVGSEDEAKKIIAQLNGGADFAKLAKEDSKDPGAAQGGDLGWFKKGDMLPEFSAAAFALQPGQITETPVHTQYGWHVIKVEGRRQAPPPGFEQARNQLRQDMIQEGVRKEVAEARQGLTIERFNPDGSTPKATDTAVPPPAPAPAK
ncbi:MAG TPA: peptidylprolyl isomerase [Acetobacteraceae bacterium]|nr:peptidylprolyl isomerase [Acetobacteraceae bacterium]